MSLNLMAAAMGKAKFSSAVMGPINYPIHKGAPNPAHGKFYIAGSIPAACYDLARNDGRGGSVLYASEADSVAALIAAGAVNVQRCDCSFALRDGIAV